MNPQQKFLCLGMFVFLSFFVTQAQAGDDTAKTAIDPGTSARDQALQQVREELSDVNRRWYGLTRFRFSYPQKFSAGFGAIFVKQPTDADCSVSCMVHGWQFEVEPGLYGLQGSVGWGKLVGETGGTKRLFHTVHWGWALRGVVLRTWGDSRLRPQSQTLVGIEGSLSIIGLNFSMGVLNSLSSSADEDWILTAGAGWGF